MAQIDFDLARYIAHRKGRVLQRARDGAAYGFSREIRRRRNLAALRPVAVAIDATSRRWKRGAKDQLIRSSSLVSSVSHPFLYSSAEKASRALGLENFPPIYISDDSRPIGAWVLGTEDDSLLSIHPKWLQSLSESEMLALIGSCLGYVQNNLVPYTTALYYLEHDAVFFLRWIVTPAIIALRSWAKTADICCDRAGLIAIRNTGIATAALLRSSGGYTGPLEYENLDNPDTDFSAPVAQLLLNNQHLRHRVEALHVFSQTYLYSKLIDDSDPSGLPTDTADELVAEILST